MGSASNCLWRNLFGHLKAFAMFGGVFCLCSKGENGAQGSQNSKTAKNQQSGKKNMIKDHVSPTVLLQFAANKKKWVSVRSFKDFGEGVRL